MRVVFDTNVVISGLLWSGTPHQIFSLARDGKFTIIITEVMIDEFKDVISRLKFGSRLKKLDKTPEQIVTDYLQIAVVVEAASIDTTVSRDPDDDAILACAVSGQAQYVVTGDPHLLELKQYKSMPIITPHDFFYIIQKDSSEE